MITVNHSAPSSEVKCLAIEADDASTIVTSGEWSVPDGGGGGATTNVIALAEPVLLSTPVKCTVSADTGGHRGPPEVILLDGDDWEMGRWAVHGKDWNQDAKYESHWIQLEWSAPVLVTRVVLDWETAYSERYELQIRSSPHRWETVLKAPNANIAALPPTGESVCFGAKYPLHRVHEMDVPFSKWTTSLRLVVRETAFKNGFLSLWNIKVLGYESTPSDGGTPPFFLQTPTKLLENLPDFVVVSASDGGHAGLGVHNILIEGNDFNNDRWLVPRENISGGLWIRLDFLLPVLTTKVVLDWCGDCARDYELQFGATDEWHTVHRATEADNMKMEAWGKPLSLSMEGCLHHIHTIALPLHHQPSTSLRLWIDKPATFCADSVAWLQNVNGLHC